MGAYLELIRQQEQTNKQETDLRTNMMQAAETDPDALARAKKSADLLGLPLQTVQERLPEVEKQAFVEGFGYRDLIKNAPKTAAWLQEDALNAGLAKDDVENLTALEGLLRYQTDMAGAFGGGLVGNFAGSTLSGFGNLYNIAARALGAGVDAVVPQAVSDALRTPIPWWLSPGEIMRRPGQALKQAGQMMAPPRERQNLMTDVYAGVGQLSGQIAAHFVTGGASSIPTMFAQGTDIMTDKTAQDDAPQALKDTAALTGGVVTAITEKYGLEKILNRVPPAIRNRTLRFIADKVAAGGIEAGQEFTEALLHDLSRIFLTNENAPMLEGVEREMTAAGISAAVVRSALGVRGHVTQQQQQQFFESLGETTKSNKLRERLPEKFRELAEKYSGAQNVFVDAGQFNQYFQSIGQDPAAAAADIGVKNYAEALAAGTDVVIPMADFVAKVAPTDNLQGLMPDLKLAQGEMSAREYEAWQQEQGEQQDTVLETDADPETKQAIFDDVLGQLVGRFERSTAESYATTYATAITTLAGRMGMDPMELHRQYGLRIITPLPDVLTQRAGIDTLIDPMIDALRAGNVPTDAEVNGPTLIEFLRERGGVKDFAGELAGRDANRQTPKGKRNLIQPDGLDMDIAREAAVEAGYLPEDTDINDFLEAIDNELRGQPVYALRNVNQSLQEQQAALASLGEWLDQMGVDLASVDNAAVKAMIAGLQDGQQYDQIDDFDTSVVLYRGSQSDEIELRTSDGWEHGVIGVSTTPNEDYAKFNGDNVKRYYGRKGPKVNFFDLVEMYEEETGNEAADASDEDLTAFAKSKGFVASVFNDPQAGQDIRYFDAADLISVDEYQQNQSGSIAMTSDGYVFYEQPDGSWIGDDGDMGFDSISDLAESDPHLMVNGKIYDEVAAARESKILGYDPTKDPMHNAKALAAFGNTAEDRAESAEFRRSGFKLVGNKYQQRYNQGAKVDNLQMVAERGERATGSRAVISPDEKQAIADSAEKIGVSVAEITKVVRDHKLAHPTAQGWAPLVFIRAVVDDGKVTYEYKIIPYDFNTGKDGKTLDPNSPEYKRKVNAVARAMSDEVRRIYNRAQAGDKNAENILAQAGWYKAMRTRLRQEFGGLGDLFADLLGATSPNTPVRDNWSNAVDALRRASRGDFDALIPQWESWANKIDELELDLRAWFNERMAEGLSKKAIKALPEYATKIAALKEARKLPDSLLPTKETGKKYGFNGRNVARAMVDLWRVVRDADQDIARGGTAPKALNFSGNLIGFRERATIDVWAARMLQRLAGGMRIPSMAESGVSGEIKSDGTTTLQFGFGQDVFTEAVKRIRSDETLKTNKTLADINDDDLQAVVWFVEKEIWTVNNWTSAAGEGGSFELEASLSGAKDQARIKELRRILDSSKSKPEQKATARAELAALERTVDRFVGGLSIQMSADTQGIDFVPTDSDMARLLERMRMAIYEADAGATVLASKALSTEGRYGSVERSLDLELVTREGYDANQLWLRMLQEAQEARQDSTFLARVLRDDEDVDLTRHRPGIEIYFREGVERSKLDGVLSELAKEGVEFLTVVVDGRRLDATMAGAMPSAVGVRVMYVPEFMQRYGMEDFRGLDDSSVSAKIQQKAIELEEIAHRVSLAVDNVSFAGQFWYDMQVAFSHEYEEKINAITTRTAEGDLGQAGAKVPWAGQSIQAGIESANRQADQAARGEPDGRGVLGGDEAGSRTFNQDVVGDKRGYITIGADRKLSIALLEKADLSTFLHETGHAYLEILGDLAERADAPQQIKDDYQTILNWMGVKSRRDIGVKQHELFARANEAYLMEGKSPSSALRGVFSRFKAWLTMIYRSISRLNVELTPEIRAVFDRIYASDAEIDAAKAEANLQPLFLDATAAGMTDAEFDAYRKTVELASVKAQDELRADMMREYQREQAKWWKERRTVVREEVAAEVAKQPVYAAFAELTKGDMKLNKSDLVRRYGDAYLKRLPRSFQRVYTVEGGTDLDMAAEMFGFDSGDAMVQALVNMRPMKDLIEAETDARMRDEYGDMRFDGTMAEKAETALHNDQRANVLMAELRALRRKQREVSPFVRAERQRQTDQRRAAREAAAGVPPAEYFKNVARGMVSQQQVRELQPNRYLLAERKASRRSFEAMAKGDVNVAAQEKQRELLNHYLYLEAAAARESAEKIAEYADGLSKKAVQEKVGKGGEEYLLALNEILAGYEFRRATNKQLNVREALRAAMTRAEAEGEVIDVMTDDDGNIIDPALLNVRNYRELTIDELQAVRDMLKNIVHVASEKNKFRAAEVKATFDELAAAGIAEIEAGTKAKDKPRRSLRTPWQDKKRFVAGIPQSWRGLYSYIQKASGFAEDAKGLNNTTLWNYIVRPLNEAAAREAVMLREAALKLDEIFQRYSTTYLYGKGKQVAPGITLNKQEQIMIAASYGTETGRQRMLDNGFDGRGFTQDEIDAILNSLEEVDWQVVQDIWNLFDSYWSQISDKTQRVTGIRPEKVEALPFETRFGTMPGGYSPIAYETMLDNRAAAQDSAQIAKEMQQAAYTRSTTRRGFLKQRVQQLQGKAVRYDFGVIYKHLNEVIHDITHHEALRDVQKLLTHKVDGRSVLDEITLRLGDGVRDEIRLTLEDIAVGDMRSMSATERVMEKLAKGSSIAGLGYNVWSALQNFTGIFNSVSVLGPKAVFSGALEWIGSPAHMLETVDQVYEKSEFMRTRFLNMNRDVAAFRGKLEERTGQQAVDAAYQAYRNGGFWMMVRMQQVVDIPTWLGAYRSALRSDPSMTEANAIALADQAVINAQGGGRNVDMSRFMRGKGWARVWTVYAGYFNVVYQRTIESLERAGVEGYTPAAVGRMVTDSFFLLMAPAILTLMMKEAINLMSGGEPDDEDELMMKYLKEQTSYILAMFPFIRETAAGFLGFGTYSGPVGARFFKEVNDLGRQISQGEVDENLVKEAVGVAGFGVGLPTSQIIKTYDGIEAYMDGDATMLAPVFGPPRE